MNNIHTSFPSQNLPFTNPRNFSRKRNSVRRFCNSDGVRPDSSPEGDKRKQDLLARIAMLQTQKVRLTDFLDERSAYLTQFAEDADEEFDKIGENALKELDEAGARIMENLESRMQSLEETAEVNRQEIEKNEKVIEDFEEQIERDRNEGLFFKNLGDKPPQTKTKAKVEAQKVQEITKENAGSKIRRNIYLALIALLVITIGNAVLATPEVEWPKIAALGLILIGLLAQFIYEQSLLTVALIDIRHEAKNVRTRYVCKAAINLMAASRAFKAFLHVNSCKKVIIIECNLNGETKTSLANKSH